MKIKVVNVSKEKKYLSEVFDELPLNCILDKTLTGAGGTYVAIHSKKPYVIAVPYVNLIINKQMQNPEILGVYSGMPIEEVVLMANSQESPKIMVTYDSLPRLAELLDTSKYYLLIDEYHKLFQDYSFRKDACNGVLKVYNKFAGFTFMTATPLENVFTLDELLDLDVVKVNWEDSNKIKINSIKCKNVTNTVVEIAKSYLDGSLEGNAYFFVNSLNFITTIINKCKLTDANTRLIYSRNNDKKMKIKNSDTLSDPKKINFITSTAFEGQDFFDEDGVIYTVSDGNSEHTLLDINTTLPQIVGRIRNIRSTEVYQLYSNAQDVDISPTEYSELLDRKEKDLEYILPAANEEGNTLEVTLNFKLSSHLLKGDDGKWYFDKNLKKLDYYLYQVHYIYSRCGYLQTRIQHSEKLQLNDYNYNVAEINNRSNNQDKKTFKQFVEEYNITASQDVLEQAEEKYPFFKEAFEKIGYERIKELKFAVQEVKRELVRITTTSDLFKTINQFKYIKYQFMPSAKIKKNLQRIYDGMGLNKTAKASDILEMYNAVATSKRIDGKVVGGYVINEPLINK